MTQKTTQKKAQKKFDGLRSDSDATIGRFGPEEIFLRLLADVQSDKAVLVRRIFFEGGDILACRRGLFRFTFETDEPKTVELAPGEALVIYPGNVVTIESIRANGQLSYAIFNGSRIGDFFDSFGFYDRLKFQADAQHETFESALRMFEGGNAHGALSLLTDALLTFDAVLRGNGRAVLFDAIKIIHRNLAQGVVRLKPVCDELSVSRATLHRAFAANGLTGPGEFLRNEQFRKARFLLITTKRPLREIAEIVGIPSPVYFTEFIRKFTGMTPTELRNAGFAANVG